MFNLKIKYIYDIYKNIKDLKKRETLIILLSLGIDSSLIFSLSKLLINKNCLKLVHINHNYNLTDKFIKNKFKKLFLKLKIKYIIIKFNKKNSKYTELNLRNLRNKFLKFLKFNY